MEIAHQALTTAEDGLADAYALFKQQFTGSGFDQRFPIGFGFHPMDHALIFLDLAKTELFLSNPSGLF